MDEVVAYQVAQGVVFQRYYPHYNHLYSVAALTDSTGAVVERYSYDAFGKQAITAPGGAVRGRSAVGFDRTFTGYITDNETGLLHARARQYSPTLGRFVGRDPHAKHRFETYVESGITATERVVKDKRITIHGRSWSVETIYEDKPVGMFRPQANDGYVDGWSLYAAYFAPNRVDPTGMACCVYELICPYPAGSGWHFVVCDSDLPMLGLFVNRDGWANVMASKMCCGGRARFVSCP